MILYCICTTEETFSAVEHQVRQMDFPGNIEVRPFRQIKINDSNAKWFGAITDKLQQFRIDVTSSQVGFYLSCSSIWLDFISTKEQHCLILKDILPGKGSAGNIFSVINQFPSTLDILFPFDKNGHEAGTETDQSLEQSIEKINTGTILLELLLFNSTYALSRAGATKLLEMARLLDPAEQNKSIPLGKYEMTACYYNTGWSEISFTKAQVKEREEWLRMYILKSNFWTPETKKMSGNILQAIYQISADNGIDLILHGGSLLGYVRHGGVMPWDDDIDLGIHEDKLTLFLSSISQLEELQFAKIKEEGSGIHYYKIWNNAGIRISGCTYTFPFVDVWLYKAKQEHIVFHNGIIFPNGLKAPFNEVNFEGFTFRIPANYLECLDSMYEDWRHRIKVFSWSHRLEKLANPPFEMAITVDANGRMIEEGTATIK